MIDWDSDPELAELRREFIDSFHERRSLLAAVISVLRTSPAGMMISGEADSRGQLQMIAHKLSGVASTYGFPELGRIATEIDDKLSSEPGKIAASELLEEALRLEKELSLTSSAGSPASVAKS